MRALRRELVNTLCIVDEAMKIDKHPFEGPIYDCRFTFEAASEVMLSEYQLVTHCLNFDIALITSR